MKPFITQRIEEAQQVQTQVLSDESLLSDIESVTSCLWEVINRGNSIFFCGNGGSAADAQHLATELSGRFLKDRKAIKAEALGANMAFTTAVGNDYGFDRIFARSLEALGRKGDVVVLISTSGISKNIHAVVDQARIMGIKTVAFTGNKGKRLVEKCDLALTMPSHSVPRIQEAYMLVGHIICEHLENTLITLNPDR